MDFVDEQDIARLQIGQQRGEIAGALDYRAGGGAKSDPHLARDDLRQGGFAEPRRPEQQHMVERFAARLGGLDKDPQIVPQTALADKLGQALRPQRRLRCIAVGACGIDDAAVLLAHGDTPAASSCKPARISASVGALAPSRWAAAATAPKASARR